MHENLNKDAAARYAVLSGLLDEALDLPEDLREAWIDGLPEIQADLRPTLRHLLSADAKRETAEFLKFSDQFASVVRSATAAASSDSVVAGEPIGPYKLIRELGRGGMGSVWLAERADGAFRRSVALKLPYASWSGNFLERMARERDILAGLEHPNIARFYDAGVDGIGRPFMALEYVEGSPIDAYCNTHKLSITRRLGLVIEVAKAVAYAHSKLVVHRDLKPGNVLVTANGDVRLLDFGIAKLIQSESLADSGSTEFSARLMTPDYASPEQIKGEAIGTPTDVYSLAVLTYELLTASRPYKLKRKSPAELEQAIAEADPLLASAAARDASARRQLRGDLDAVLNKGMKKAPAERYSTIDAFAADLTRYLQGDPVLARPDTAGYRFRKFATRHRVGIAATAIVIISLAAATSISVLQAHRATEHAATATLMKNFLLQLFTAEDNRASGSKPAGQTTALELLDKGRAQLLTSLDSEPAAKLELLLAMADIYERLDALPKSLELYQLSVKVADKQFGPASKEKARVMAQVVGSYVYAGRWTEAEGYVDEVERAFDASADYHSVEYAQLLKLKGNIQRRHGSVGLLAARETLEKSAAVFARDFPTSPGYIGVLMFLTGTLLSLDKVPEAIRVANAAVSQASALKGDDSQRASALSMLASAEDQAGDFSAAIKDYDRASTIYSATVGPKHFLYLQNENLRGFSLQSLGQRDQGLRLVESTTERVFDVRPGSNTLASCLTRSSEVYLRDGAYDDANAAAAQAMNIPAAGQNIVLHTRLLLDQASALTALGRFDEAQNNIALASKEVAGTGPHSSYADAETGLYTAQVQFAQEHVIDAESQIGRAQKDSEHAQTRRERYQQARILALSAQIKLKRGKFSEAAAVAAQAQRVLQSPDLRDDVFLQSEVGLTAADALCAGGAGEAGLQLARETLSHRSTIMSPGSPLIALAQISAARCLKGLGKRELADQLLAIARKTIEADPRLGPQYRASLAAAAVTSQ